MYKYSPRTWPPAPTDNEPHGPQQTCCDCAKTYPKTLRYFHLRDIDAPRAHRCYECRYKLSKVHQGPRSSALVPSTPTPSQTVAEAEALVRAHTANLKVPFRIRNWPPEPTGLSNDCRTCSSCERAFPATSAFFNSVALKALKATRRAEGAVRKTTEEADRRKAETEAAKRKFDALPEAGEDLYNLSEAGEAVQQAWFEAEAAYEAALGAKRMATVALEDVPEAACRHCDYWLTRAKRLPKSVPYPKFLHLSARAKAAWDAASPPGPVGRPRKWSKAEWAKAGREATYTFDTPMIRCKGWHLDDATMEMRRHFKAVHSNANRDKGQWVPLKAWVDFLHRYCPPESYTVEVEDPGFLHSLQTSDMEEAFEAVRELFGMGPAWVECGLELPQHDEFYDNASQRRIEHAICHRCRADMSRGGAPAHARRKRIEAERPKPKRYKIADILLILKNEPLGLDTNIDWRLPALLEKAGVEIPSRLYFQIPEQLYATDWREVTLPGGKAHDTASHTKFYVDEITRRWALVVSLACDLVLSPTELPALAEACTKGDQAWFEAFMLAMSTTGEGWQSDVIDEHHKIREWRTFLDGHHLEVRGTQEEKDLFAEDLTM